MIAIAHGCLETKVQMTTMSRLEPGQGIGIEIEAAWTEALTCRVPIAIDDLVAIPILIGVVTLIPGNRETGIAPRIGTGTTVAAEIAIAIGVKTKTGTVIATGSAMSVGRVTSESEVPEKSGFRPLLSRAFPVAFTPIPRGLSSGPYLAHESIFSQAARVASQPG